MYASNFSVAKNVVTTINPSNGEKIKSYHNMSSEKVNQLVKFAKKSFEKWKKTDLYERNLLIQNLAKILAKNKRSYAEMITLEMGKPLSQSLSEIEKCIWLCGYYSKNSELFLQDKLVSTEYYKSIISFEPLGIIAGIMPWNFPFWQVMRYAIPAIIAGNVTILKHSSVCLGSSLLIQDLFNDAQFPEGVFQSVVGNYQVGEFLLQSDIDAISITGSVDTGKRVAELASQNLRKYVLELGGSDPFIVLEDADLEQAAKIATKSRLLNTGQSCIAAKRFIVVKTIAKEFTDLFVENVKKEVLGNPMDINTTIGPLVRENQLHSLENQIIDAKNKKGKILVGGKSVDSEGYFYEPTIVSKTNNRMDILRQEVFGPAAPILIVENEKKAVREANNSEFGLGCSIWTNNLEKGLSLSRQIESGIVSVNEMVKSDPRLPFGGIKLSGIGRELSEFGIKEFVNIKSIVIEDLNKKLFVE